MREGRGATGLCTVRPNVLELHRELEGLGVEVEAAQLGPDVFNELDAARTGGHLP